MVDNKCAFISPQKTDHCVMCTPLVDENEAQCESLYCVREEIVHAVPGIFIYQCSYTTSLGEGVVLAESGP